MPTTPTTLSGGPPPPPPPPVPEAEDALQELRLCLLDRALLGADVYQHAELRFTHRVPVLIARPEEHPGEQGGRRGHDCDEGSKEPHQTGERAGDQHREALARVGCQDLGGDLTEQSDAESHHQRAESNAADTAHDLQGQDSAHGGGEDHGQVLQKNYEGEKTLLPCLQVLHRAGGAASFFGEMPDANPVCAYYGNLDSVDERVNQDAYNENQAGQLRADI